MVNYPTILNLPQEDINRQLYEMIVKAQAGDDAALKEVADDIKDIQEAIGSETKSGTILYRIKALETANATPGGK